MTELDKYEEEKLISIMDGLEDEVRPTYNRLSGGFVDCEYAGATEELIFLNLKFGVQNDAENRVHSEEHVVNRQSMELCT